jgi:hypothetical protein
MTLDFTMTNLATDLIVALIAGIGGAYGLLKYLGKTLVQHQIDKSLKAFDGQLARRAEALKTELSIYAHEQNVALSRIDAQRAMAIQEVYLALRAWVNPASAIAVGSPFRNSDPEAELNFYLQQAEQGHKAGFQLVNTLTDNAIYFDLELFSKLASLSSKCMHSIEDFLSVLRQGAADGASPETLLSHVETHREVFSKLHSKEIQPVIVEITDSFRKVLGVIHAKV